MRRMKTIGLAVTLAGMTAAAMAQTAFERNNAELFRQLSEVRSGGRSGPG